MKFAFIAAQEVAFPVEAMCRVLEVSRSGYYACQRRPTSARRDRDAQLAATIAAVHQGSRGTYGSPRVHAELRARGERVGKKRVERLMRDTGLIARRKRRFRRTTDSTHDQPIAPNRLDRQFATKAPNAVWVTDVTYVGMTEGWLYLAVILDLFSRPRHSQTVHSIGGGSPRRRPPGTTEHGLVRTNALAVPIRRSTRLTAERRHAYRGGSMIDPTP